MECTLVAATCKCLRTKAYIQQRFLCSMWNARVISTATSQLKAGSLSKNKIYSYLLCIGGIPPVPLHWQFLLRQLGFMLNAIRAMQSPTSKAVVLLEQAQFGLASQEVILSALLDEPAQSSCTEHQKKEGWLALREEDHSTSTFQREPDRETTCKKGLAPPEQYPSSEHIRLLVPYINKVKAQTHSSASVKVQKLIIGRG